MIKIIRKINYTQILYLLRPRTFCTAVKHVGNKSQNCTIDPKEIEHFKNYAKIWWNRFYGLQTMNRLRVPFIRDSLVNRGILNQKYVHSSTPLQQLNILDVGCGGGILSEALAVQGANVTGVDVTEDLIKCAIIHAQENQNLNNEIKYIHTAIEDMVTQYKNKFDVVISSECVEHVNCVETYLKSCIQVLKPGGSIFITTINKTIPAWLVYVVLDEYILKHLPRGTHHYRKFVPPKDVTNILTNNNCEILLLQGFTHNINMRKWIWTSNTFINYAIHAVKCI